MTSPSVAEPGDQAAAGDGLTDDAFLGGRLRILQPRKGYRAGIDPVLLAAATPAQAGQSVLDLGTGAGTAILCLAARVPGLDLAAVELQADYADLARRNAARNGIALDLHCADLTRLPDALRARQFDHVIMNPPYFAGASRTAAPDAGRETALAGADLPLWADTAIRRLAPGGTLAVIHDAAALPDLLGALDSRVGGVAVHPLAPRQGRAAHRVIVSCRKGSRGAFRLLPPLVLHAGPSHAADGEDYAPAISAVLRDAAPLPGPEV
ncbi:tRNA1(Val) (adenine(37)-N6)-methyltransferase [Ovoidimarina sediminis]|uniref:tRNA1(Val) (adenine(37)-N6)-methyltransferase n=1 Tax=Ovoidimarina sediminis TaxID=3079856 RepID=UPI002909CF11|nr:methyltransferase [Rhodophyticola sp. MJ-SS7]MDU8943667.1 methyltransferase [Rhodophyticola sp. MJ-SS7]